MRNQIGYQRGFKASLVTYLAIVIKLLDENYLLFHANNYCPNELNFGSIIVWSQHFPTSSDLHIRYQVVA